MSDFNNLFNMDKFKIEPPKIEPAKYEDTLFKDMADDITNNFNKRLDQMAIDNAKSEKSNKRISIVTLIVAILTLVVTIIGAVVSIFY